MNGAKQASESNAACPSDRMAVRLEAVSFAYSGSDFCLQIPHWELPRRLQAAVIGPSGSGKTTLLQLIAGILVPQSGSVVVEGHRVDALPDALRRRFRMTSIGFVFQDFQLLDYLNVLDNIILPCRIGHPELSASSARERAAELAEAVGLSDKLLRNVARLSHGERQRVALCRALVANPQLVLADEPTGNLDPRAKLQIMKLLHEQVQRLEATLIMVTHDRQLLSGMDQVIDFESWLAEVG